MNNISTCYRKQHDTQSWSSNEFETARGVSNIVLYGTASLPVLCPVTQCRKVVISVKRTFKSCRFYYTLFFPQKS